jgi:hypothetical protein
MYTVESYSDMSHNPWHPAPPTTYQSPYGNIDGEEGLSIASRGVSMASLPEMDYWT